MDLPPPAPPRSGHSLYITAAAVPRLANRDEILRNARPTADGLSPAELESLDVESMARELGVPLDAPAPDAAAASARAQVQQSVMAQLVGTERYTAAQAESQAQLWGAMFGRLGEVTGQDPVALYERYAAGIDAAEAPAEGAEAQPRTLMQRGMDALRSLLGRPQVATDGRVAPAVVRDAVRRVAVAGGVSVEARGPGSPAQSGRVARNNVGHLSRAVGYPFRR